MTMALSETDNLTRFAPRLVVFDLDGTLIDTAADLARSIDEMLHEIGRQECGEETVRLWIGSGIDRLVNRALTNAADREPSAQEFRRGLAIFKARYQANNGLQSQLYTGAGELLRQLRAHGLSLACVTNKSAEFTRQLLQKFALTRYLEAVVSGDTVAKRKPDPDALLHACKLTGVTPRDALMVGDSRNDILAARAAGMPVAVVSYGYNRGETLDDYAPDLIIDCLTELTRYLQLPDPAGNG